MKKSWIVAATFAAITLGAANVANAGVAGTSLAGFSAHADTQITDQVHYNTGGIGITAGIGSARGVITQALLVELAP